MGAIEKGVFGLDQNRGEMAEASMADLVFRDGMSPLQARERILGLQSWSDVVQEAVERRFPRKGAYMQMLEDTGIVVPGDTSKGLLKG